MTRDILLARWTDIGDRLVTLAQEVPEAQYAFRPTDEVRTFADVLRHVAFWNVYAKDTLSGATADGEANELPRAKYATKAKIVEALRQSVDGVKAEIKKRNGEVKDSDVDTLISFTAHSAEHFGQLVVYCRLNGIVPPTSRS